ncbi:MAG TPA: outer membrane protein assembly factor BamA [Paenalcaligenes hominis]|uniref:Outer membrane protein assembly factor BamA n=1 Tax=Paenalcaligenes hominis TaxID=643674 RepID=A0A9D3A9F2_9BURK|nr:outer membrane protein assembly factor BamA [Paenalcaligenes hominis]NJB64469.1 outer membrane protein insertion porin family [Paenalcaligenes hominis]GGE67409.1 outer membrane protein assembly factor BamA [Paenalcaligenes hominis]HJH23058.1 outer membrane protein assembly factor BamA [Paenalcaligenes hominis]
MSFSRKKPFALRAVSAALAAMLAPLVHAFTPFVIQDIQVNGVQRVDPGAVFGFLPVKVGETFDEGKASEAVQRLYSSGFFNDVKIDVENNVLVITVQERPTIASITFNGMREFNDKNITQALSQVGFSEGRVFDRSMLERAEFELKQQYLTKGKYGVEISPIITPLPRNRVGISFDVFEGDLAKIKEINIVGNHNIKTSTLLSEMQLTTSGMMTWYTGTNKYAREKLEGDIERIRSYYLDRGYLEVQIEPPQVSISPDRKDIFITLTIDEGNQYTLTDVKLAGDLLGLQDQLEPLIAVKADQVFSAEKTNQTVEAITNYLGSLGYAFANINPNPVLDRDAKTADLTFYIDPGRRVYVRRIEVGGNVRTRDEVVRREMRQQEAAWYDAGSISESRDRVDRLGYFNEVDVSTEPVPGTIDQVDVKVDVKEKPTGMINLGVGYGSTDKVMLSGGISQDNIFGSGNSLSLQVNTSKSNRTAVLAHTDPYWTKDGISKTTSLYYRRTTPYDNNSSDGDYEVTAIGTGLNFGVPISENDRIYMGASYEYNRLDRMDPLRTPIAYQDFVKEFGKSTNAVIFNLGWEKDTRDSAIAPTKGSFTRLSGDFSTLDLRYYLLSAQQQYYLPLGSNYTLALNGLVDWGKSYGGRSYPVIKTVYAGGIGTVRGYEGASLGPRDTLTGDYLGGSRRVVGTAQLYLPFPGATRDRTLRWFVFGDVGRVDNTSGGCSAGRANERVSDACGWRYAAGVGFSWQSPLGPLELSYGRALNAKAGDDKQAFQFQIGAGF